MEAQAAQPTGVITGCSSGIGFSCACDLASRGWRIFAGVRREVDGRRLVASAGENVRPLELDVTCPQSVANAGKRIGEEVGAQGLHLLVNNAGILISGPLESITVDELRRQFDVNVFGTHAVTQAMLPWLKQCDSKSHCPRIVFIGSISGRITPPYYGAYAASKHALEALCDAWRMELKPWHISVSVVQPDSVATPLWDKSSSELADRSSTVSTARALTLAEQLRAARRSGLTNRRIGMDPARVVTAVRHAASASRPRSHYPVGWRTRAAFFASAWLPARVMDAILRQSVGS